MNADLERVIALQRLDSTAADAQRKLAEGPARMQAFDARVEAARQHVAVAKARLSENQTARRAIEKDVAMHQGRLSKFREQAMAVKTNQEYHAIQKEIGYAQGEIKTLEDKVLEFMLEADELTALLKRTEKELADEQKTVEAERGAMDTELTDLKASFERIAKERADLARATDPRILSIYERVANRRNGIALSEARDGVCSICHVRLRPQVFNTVLRNEEILQCDHCNRILYYVPKPAPAATDSTTQPAPQ